MFVIGGTFMMMIIPVIDSLLSSAGVVNETLSQHHLCHAVVANAIIGYLIFNNTVHRGKLESNFCDAFHGITCGNNTKSSVEKT